MTIGSAGGEWLCLAPSFGTIEVARSDTSASQRGSYMAAVAAGPVFRLPGKKDLETSEFPTVETALIDGELAFRTHGGGHTTGPTGRHSWHSPAATSSLRQLRRRRAPAGSP